MSEGLKIPLERVVPAIDRESLVGTIAVRVVPKETTTEGGLELPEQAQTKRMIADVLKISADTNWVEVGDQVIVGDWDLRGSEGLEIGDNCHLISHSAVLAKVLPLKEKANG